MSQSFEDFEAALVDGDIVVTLGVTGSMFPSNCGITKETTKIEDVAKILNTRKKTICLRKDHQFLCNALHKKTGIKLKIPDRVPFINLRVGDLLFVLKAKGLEKKKEEEYSEQEIATAEFSFDIWTVVTDFNN